MGNILFYGNFYNAEKFNYILCWGIHCSNHNTPTLSLYRYHKQRDLLPNISVACLITVKTLRILLRHFRICYYSIDAFNVQFTIVFHSCIMQLVRCHLACSVCVCLLKFLYSSSAFTISYTLLAAIRKLGLHVKAFDC